MAVMKDKFSQWPETVAYKRMVRMLIRGQQYVPPQQPKGSVPPPTVSTAGDNATETVRDFLPLSQSAWRIGQNANGDLVARHSSGSEIVLAPAPKEGKLNYG